MKKLYDKNKKLHKHILTIIALLVIIFNAYFLNKVGQIEEILVEKIPETPEVISNLVDSYYRQTQAFANGSIAFLEENPELEEIENPYDINQRGSIWYLFDNVYYKGKYYSYYTILPIIFIMLPVYLMSHKFLNLVIVNLIVLSLVVFMSSKLYQKLVEKYIKKIPLYLYIIGYLTILFGSNIMLLMRGLKYDISVSCGVLSIVSALYCLFSLENKKHIKLVLAGIFTAFIVLSKPTYIIHYILIAYIVYILFKKHLEKQIQILYYVIPIAIIAILQMIYNYVRFDSILEFGAKYQLTGFNLYDYMKISPMRIVRAFKYYLFQTPIIDFNNFPYIFMTANFDNHLYSEWFYENLITGLIAYPIIIFSFLVVLKKAKDSQLKKMKKCMILLYIVFIIMIIINATYAGASEIYSLDYKFIAMFASVIYLLKYITIGSSKKIIPFLFIICCILNIIIILPISYSGEGLIFLYT